MQKEYSGDKEKAVLILGTVGGAINILYFIRDKQELCNFYNKGDMKIYVKRYDVTGDNYSIDGECRFYIKSLEGSELLFKHFTEKYAEFEPSHIHSPKRTLPLPSFEGSYREDIDLQCVEREWREAQNYKEYLLSEINMDVILKKNNIQILDFNIVGVKMIPKDSGAFEAYVYVDLVIKAKNVQNIIKEESNGACEAAISVALDVIKESCTPYTIVENKRKKKLEG